MTLKLADGTCLDVDQVVESIQPKNWVETKDGMVLEICLPVESNMALKDLAALFTESACTKMQSLSERGTVEYVGYNKLLGVANIATSTSLIKNIRLGHSE